MSDFLTRLVARELGLAPVVEPRIRALYETERRDHASAEPLPGPMLTPPVPKRADDRRSSAEATAPRPIERTSGPGEEPLPPAWHARASTTVRDTPPPYPYPALDRSGGNLRRTVARRSRGAEPRDSSEPPTRHGDTPTDRVQAVIRDSISVTDSIAVTDRNAADAPGPERSSEGLSHRADFLRADRSPTSAQPAIPKRLADGETLPPLVPRVHRAEEASSAASGGPVSRRPESRQSAPPATAGIEAPIHVTIGRIEVTAVTTAPRAREKQKARPRASLEEYLSKRRRGSR